MIRSALATGLLCLIVPMPAHAQDQPLLPNATQSSGAEAFVVMKEISVPIVDAGRIDGVLRISIVLQTRDAAAATELTRRMPELRAAGLRAAIEFARLHASPFTPVDVRQLSAMLTPVLTRDAPEIIHVLLVKISARGA